MAEEPQHERSDDRDVRRLLPWATDDGRPCYLLSKDGNGVVSKLADAMEAHQVRGAREVLAQARGLMDGERLGKLEYKFLADRLAEALADVLRIAESRGYRLGVEDPRPDDEADELVDAEADE
ncbi:hypothetical protein OG547_30115 [Streptomyces longwoodensis]|uniref:hypothetical protein n=1 Tax=Streptomyces longwoodensis TaxID=68231 RepID=UPI002ED36429|nr:hypothetical protein OG547_30115 [Streptomyces longwoodensis]